MIEARLLHYFLAIARERNITRAAEALHVTQPTLSKQMMELEAQLGTKLFLRGKRTLTLTEEGVFLRKQAQEIMELMDKTESAFHTGKDFISGDVYLGCAETPAMREIARLFVNLHQAYPGIQLHIFSGDADTVLERLDKGLLDIGILLNPPVYDRYAYLKLPFRDVFGLLMRQDCDLAQKKTLTFKDLNGLPLIFSQQTHNGPSRIQWFGKQYESFHIVATYNLLYNATHLVEQGVGFAFCLDGLADTENRNLTFRPFDPPLEVENVAITKKYQPFSPAMKVLMEYFLDIACKNTSAV